MTALLTVWITVIGLGVSVTHAYATGGSRNVHGRGWNLSFSPVVPLSGSNGTGETHRHLFLLGIEFPNESTPDMAPADVSASELATERLSESFFPEALTPSAVDTPALGYGIDNSPLNQFVISLPRLDPSVTLSTFARRALSGVQRS